VPESLRDRPSGKNHLERILVSNQAFRPQTRSGNQIRLVHFKLHHLELRHLAAGNDDGFAELFRHALRGFLSVTHDENDHAGTPVDVGKAGVVHDAPVVDLVSRHNGGPVRVLPAESKDIDNEVFIVGQIHQDAVAALGRKNISTLARTIRNDRPIGGNGVSPATRPVRNLPLCVESDGQHERHTHQEFDLHVH